MNDIKVLKDAFLSAEIKTFKNVIPDENWAPSDEYTNKMTELIKRHDKSIMKHLDHTGKRVFAAAAVFLLLLGTALCFGPFRNGLLKMFGITENSVGSSAFSYSVCDDETLEITGYTGVSADVAVPETISGRSVTKIKSFFSQTVVKTVSLPESITEIEEKAFKGCKGLTDIIIPKSIETIGKSAFEDCYILKNVYYAGSEYEWNRIELSDGPNSFNNADIHFNSNGQEIAEAFTMTENTGDITASSAVHTEKTSERFTEAITGTVNESASFTTAYDPKTTAEQTIIETTSSYGTTDATSALENDASDFEITDSENGITILKYIGAGKEVCIPSIINGKPVVAIGHKAFRNSKIVSVILPEKVKVIGNEAFRNCRYLSDIKLPKELKTIGKLAFDNCRSLERITLPSGVTELNEGAFSNSGLTGIVFNSGLKKIGDSAFCYCKSISEIKLPEGLESIGKYAFKGCTHLKNINIPLSVTELSDGAFSNCDMLSEITVPSGVSKISGYLFYDCSGLESIVICKGITEIGEYAFYNCGVCHGLKTIEIPDSVTKIGDHAFQYAEASFMNSKGLPSSVTYIGKGAFYGVEQITKLTLPGSLVAIDDQAFSSCYGLKEVVVPGNVKTLGNDVFAECRELETVIFEEGVEEIGYYAFSGCISLKRVDFPSSVTKIGSKPFRDCDMLVSVKVDEDNTKYLTSGNCLIDISTGTLLLAWGEAVIPKDKNIKIIDSLAFEHCTLQKINLPDTVICLNEYAFYRSSLIEVSIPLNVVEIGYNVFTGSIDLEMLFIPSSVVNINGSAFDLCPLKEIYYGGSETDWETNIDQNVRNDLGSRAEIHFLNIN